MTHITLMPNAKYPQHCGYVVRLHPTRSRTVLRARYDSELGGREESLNLEDEPDNREGALRSAHAMKGTLRAKRSATWAHPRVASGTQVRMGGGGGGGGRGEQRATPNCTARFSVC